MKPLIYTVLLLAALGFAYQAWNREIRDSTPADSVLLWDVSVRDIDSVSYEAERGRLVIERRRDELGEYYWAVLTPLAAADPITSPPGDPHSAMHAAASPTGPIEFLLGQEGDQLLRALASPRARRDLGIVGEQELREYGLAPPNARLTLDLGRTVRQLDVGNVEGESGDRYVRDPDSGRVYTLPAQLLGVIETANRSLPELRPHAFFLAEVARVTLRTPRTERAMMKEVTPESSDFVWTSVQSPHQADQTFSDFVDLLWQLWIANYRPGMAPDQLKSLMRIDYIDADGRTIGWLEFFEGPRDLETIYYVQTELSRVPATVVGGLGERVHREVMRLF